MSHVTQTTKGFDIIFVHSRLDDYGLTPAEFRIFCHLSRRASDRNRYAFPSVTSISKICQIGHNLVREALKNLQAFRMIKVEAMAGKPNHYFINSDPEDWTKKETAAEDSTPTETGRGSDLTPPETGRTPLPKQGGDPSLNRETKVIQLRKSTEGPKRKRSDDGGGKDLKTIIGDHPLFENQEFTEAFDGFIENRKNLRAPLTPRALILILKKLPSDNPSLATQMVDQSVERGWKSVFEIKEKTNAHKNNGTGNKRNGVELGVNDPNDYK